jgi:hypothetical protein
MEGEDKLFEDPPQRISKDSAKVTLDEILKKYRIKFEHIVNDQGKEGAETWYNKIVEAIRDGLLETNVDPVGGFQIIQHTSKDKTVVYNEYGFKAAREYAKQRDNASAVFAMLGSLCGKGLEYFESEKNFAGQDIKLADSIGLIFLF